MEKRTLGRTGHQSTVATFGAFSVGYVDQDEADCAIQLILDHGVNHIDIAPSYGHAMERVAPWMPDIRDKMFLGSKTTRRTRDEAWRDVEQMMKRLNVENFDLFQLHSVGNISELDKATASGGALETLIEMREQGLTQWLGITGHGPQVPITILESLRRFDFDTVMFPLNPASMRDANYRRDAEALIAEANARDIGRSRAAAGAKIQKTTAPGTTRTENKKPLTVPCGGYCPNRYTPPPPAAKSACCPKSSTPPSDSPPSTPTNRPPPSLHSDHPSRFPHWRFLKCEDTSVGATPCTI
ncbi:MAG: aldo/keto reductase [Candidatus Latescibacteria bacterium]|nr:aldo/keto reductase [Candidatus Latescibacterota bacterium]